MVRVQSPADTNTSSHSSRDQELRFTVHESPDYYQLKVSVFNDDKKTDLIGETWIDLGNLIIPGGGQSDQWHGLQFKGKYAGEVRIEMTYYDTRPEDEAVVERRKEAAEKKAKTSATMASTLSGPRQLKPVKRRPLPEDPTGASPSRSPAPEYIQQSPAYAHATPPRPVGGEYARPSSRHGGPPDTYAPQMQGAPPSPQGYDMPDELPRTNLSNRPPTGNQAPYTLERMSSQHIELYEPHFPEGRPIQEAHQAHPTHREYDDQIYQGEHHWQTQPVQDPYDYPPETDDMYRRNSYEAPRHSSHHAASPDQGRYYANPNPYGQHARNSSPGLPPISPANSAEPSVRHQYNVPTAKSDGRRNSPLRQSMSREEERPSYASMQPTVEDEQDDGSAPPPPPVHRSTFNAGSQRPGPSPASYKAYSQEYVPQLPDPQEYTAPASMSPAEMDLSHGGISMSSKMASTAQARPYSSNTPHKSSSTMPPSLVPGYDTMSAGTEPSQATPDSRAGRIQMYRPPPPAKDHYSYDAAQHQMSVPSPRTSPAAVEERAVPRKSRSTSPNPGAIIHRKSVSPRPLPAEDRELTGTPFSPDSYDALNPNAPRSSSATGDLRSRYETPERETDSPKVSQAEVGLIIGDDGRLIDPSDHLPSETWAPEPERKTRKPEVIIRFKHAPQSAPHSARASPREIVSPHHQTIPRTPESAGRTGRNRLQKTNGRPHSFGPAANPSPHTPPQPNGAPREYDSQGSTHQRNYSTPHAYSGPQPLRRSASPSPSPYQASPLYASTSGPLLPAKVPIAQPMNQNYPAVGMDALSQEIQSIDIGSAGWDSGRPRRYAPRTTVLTSGYAR
jgi:hypothetical protein